MADSRLASMPPSHLGVLLAVTAWIALGLLVGVVAGQVTGSRAPHRALIITLIARVQPDPRTLHDRRQRCTR